MRRLARHLFTLCSVISLLLCVLVAVLWVTSYFWANEFSFRTKESGAGRAEIVERRVFIAYGRLLLYARRLSSNDAATAAQVSPAPPRLSYTVFFSSRFDSCTLREQLVPHTTRWLGKRSPSDPWLIHYAELRIPFWMVSLVLAAMPAAWFAGKQRLRRRRAAGRCTTCGYDLRASPDRCPECGTAAPVKQSA